MKILSYLEAHQQIETYLQQFPQKTLSESTRSRIIRLSGRLDIWLQSLTQLLLNQPHLDETQLLHQLQSHNLLQPIFNQIPSAEHPFLTQPEKAPNDSWLKTHGFITPQNKLFSPLFSLWLNYQNIPQLTQLTISKPSPSETKLLNLLYHHQNQIITKDQIAETLWGSNWYQQYSDWTINTLIHNLRQKLKPDWQLITFRSHGYLLKPRLTPPNLDQIQFPSLQPPDKTIVPPRQYLEYMNDSQKSRRVYSDLFQAIEQENVPIPPHPQKILSINSYSYDNVDTLAQKFPQAELYFINFDPRAVQLHSQRIQQLKLNNAFAFLDDIRQTKLQPESFDLIINDFRLNFNLSYQADRLTMTQTHQLLNSTGLVLISVVIDARYESSKYGQNQEKAPLNLNQPWHFHGLEGLIRHCHTIPYYKRLFRLTHFQIVQEFDFDNGRHWGDIHSTNPLVRPYFRRFLLKKH